MIAKGAARNNPRQLAVYLMRVERYSTGEPVELLELQSGWASTLRPDSTSSRIASRLIEAFRDWQVLTEGTRQGRDGLYHAEISPAPKYAETMTPEQWKRAADILGEELGFKDQPRAIVLHGGTDGRKHMHIVWARTDVEAMKIISDGYNFAAHEKASHRMELEFGHDFVPGKHHKRDRSLQEEFPRQEYDFAEAQMAERTGKTVEERKAEIRALQTAAANGQEFKKALEDAGYMLAQGHRGYIVVDEAGTFSALSKNLQGAMKKAEVEAFMADVPLAQLPTIDEAKGLQRDKALAADRDQLSPEEAPAAPRSKAGPEMSQEERKEQIASLRKSSDNAQAFKNALEAAGYVLARGDKRGFVLVDGEGEVFSLSKYLASDIRGKEYKAFMAPIDAATLPSVDDAKALQKEHAEKSISEPVQQSKFLPSEPPPKAPEHAPAPASSEFVPEKPEALPPSKFLQQPAPPAPTAEGPYHTPKPSQDWTERTITPEFQKADPEAERRVRERQRAAELRAKFEEREIRALRKEIWQEQVADMQQHAEANKQEYTEAEQATKNQAASKMEDFDIQQQEKLQAAEPTPKKGLRAIVDRILTTEEEREKQAAQQREEAELLKARQEQERQAYVKKLEQDRARELDALRERHLHEQAEREKAHDQELDRRLREKKRALDLQAEIEANERARADSGWAEDFKKEKEYPWHEVPKEDQPGRTLAKQFDKADPQAERHQREKKRAEEMKAELEANDRAREESGWAEDFKKEQEYSGSDAPEPQSSEQKLTEEFKKTDPGAQRREREKKRAADLRAELEAEERKKGLDRGEGLEPPDEGK